MGRHSLMSQMVPLFLEAGFLPRNRIVWHFRYGLHTKRRFSGRHETILVFSKGDWLEA
jgi:adenine-specific DNA-methyltransferase